MKEEEENQKLMEKLVKENFSLQQEYEIWREINLFFPILIISL